MTLLEFRMKIPDIIDHIPSGYGELEIVINKSDKKGVCYRHPNNSASFGTYGATWLEVYDKLSKHLREKGYIK